MPDIVIYTKSSCGYCRWAKHLLGSKGVSWTEINVSKDSDRYPEMLERSGGQRTAPQIFIGDRHVGGYHELAGLEASGLLDRLLDDDVEPEPHSRDQAQQPGVASQEDQPLQEAHHRLVILGSGCAGLTAAIYAARANLEPLVVEGLEFGGQLYTTTDVENYPAFPDGIQGPELIDRMRAQAERFGAMFQRGNAQRLALATRPFGVHLGDGTRLLADAVIVATGASPKEIGVPNERELRGYGVSTCATCDAAFFRDQEVAVVGGGDSAMEEGLFLTKFASRVTVIHRRDELRASKIMQDRALANPKMAFLWNTEVVEFVGSQERGLQGVRIRNNRTGEERLLEVSGCFTAIGHDPNSEVLGGSSIGLDELGYVTGNGKHLPRTEIEGIFVAGDVHDHDFRQAVTAAGYGCQAALAAERWLEARTPVETAVIEGKD